MHINPDPVPKLNPYPVLLLTGVLMFVTVFVFQFGSGLALIRAGAASVDEDVSTLVARAWVSSESSREARTAQPAQSDPERPIPPRLLVLVDATGTNDRPARN